MKDLYGNKNRALSVFWGAGKQRSNICDAAVLNRSSALCHAGPGRILSHIPPRRSSEVPRRRRQEPAESLGE